jgi:hypothetical protein
LPRDLKSGTVDSIPVISPSVLTVVEDVLANALPGTVSGARSLLDAYARASSTFGRTPLTLDEIGLRQLRGTVPDTAFEHWACDDAARALLLIAHRKTGRTGPAFVADALACYDQGDSREQQSWLRAIALWPEAGEFLQTAIDACRTNIIPVFEAIACENPYPASYFPDLNFNQMVLKALFNSIGLSRVVGLKSRLNAELSRMARDYAAERTAAGRAVPPDIGLAIHDLAGEL